jgi:uncharacterized repeat protein (TIGR03803 family)
MALSRRLVTGLVVFLVVASLPSFAVAGKRGDVGASQDGLFDNCPPDPNNGVCPFLQAEGTATLTGKDMSGNTVTVAINLYDWGYYPCAEQSCQKKPVINFAVLDVTLTGTDTAGIESLVVKGVLSGPTYVACDGSSGGLACIDSPQPDGFDVQEPTPIAGADSGSGINTRWDFGGFPPLNPPLPAIPFDQLACLADDGPDRICDSNPSPLGEAILVVANSIAKNKLTANSSNYSVTLTDGTELGTFAVPAAPTKQVASTNNTQATATVITKASYKDYTDASEAYPQINADGTEQYPEGFTPLPLSNPPPCNPINGVTGQTDNRSFRTAWYSYTAPSDGTIAITTAGSRYDTLVYVFTGSASQPTVVSCNDNPPSGGLLQAVTSFDATQGTSYQIVVGETPSFQTNVPGALTGYPLSVDSVLHFSLQFEPVTLTSTPNPSFVDQSVTFSVVVSGSGATPTGTVTFKEGAAILGKVSLVNGQASFATPFTKVGTFSIVASYSGDQNYPAANSEAYAQVVGQYSTNTIIASSSNPSTYGQAVTFTATVSSAGPTPTGTATFKNGNASLGSATLSGGVAHITTSTLPRGTLTITASYSGDAENLKSTSQDLEQQVENAASTTTLVSSLNPSTVGQSVMFTATVTAPGGTPTGTVDFYINGQYAFGATLKSGSAEMTASQLALGSNVITAVYSGNSKVSGSTSAPLTQVVGLPVFSILHSFAGGTDGSQPLAGLVLDAQGNLYGTTCCGGGNNGRGTVFEVDAAGQETVLHSFTGTAGDGANPAAALVLDSQGNLYGTTKDGGNLACGGGSGCGTVFKIDTTGQETVLYSFTGTGGDGAYPIGGLALDSAGNLYGTTEYGGDPACNTGGGCGTVFEIASTGQESVLYSFTETGGDGAVPAAGLVRDSQNNLYGTTEYGGNLACYSGGLGGCGTVFEVASTGTETVLHQFSFSDGGFPVARLVRDSQGNLYGTTTSGGHYGVGGTVFEFAATGQESVLYSFSGTGGDGESPEASVVRDSLGNLYGTTTLGGDLACNGGSGCGTVFMLSGSGETLLYTFTGANGAAPVAGLVRDTQGNLYGTTMNGGANDLGTVFKLTVQ